MSQARPLVFRRSARLFTYRLGLLVLVTFGGLAILMHPDWLAAAGISGMAGVVASLWFYFTRHRPVGITVDETGIVRRGEGDPVAIRWVDVSEVAIGETLLPHRDGLIPIRFCLVRGRGSRKIAFADLTQVFNRRVWVGASEATPVTDVADADILLGIVADRVDDEKLLPSPATDDEDEAAPERSSRTDLPRERKPFRLRAGVIALVAKLGTKLAKPLVGLFKGTQGVLALASVGALALLFSWQGVIALLVMLLFHEYGHVHAMRRSGIPVKGIYFIPFVGAAAVAEDIWRTRSQQAYIALSGPLWGAGLTLLPLGVVAATGDRYPLAAAVAAAWALINLFNLLPITPLDGGRVLSALGYSIHSRVALVASLATLVGGVGLALWAGLHLFVVLGVVGILELSAERSAARRLSKMAYSPRIQSLPPEGLARLMVLTRPGHPDPLETSLRRNEIAYLSRMAKLARIEPMSARQAALWLGLYVVVAVGLAASLFWIASVHSDLQSLVEILR